MQKMIKNNCKNKNLTTCQKRGKIRTAGDEINIFLLKNTHVIAQILRAKKVIQPIAELFTSFICRVIHSDLVWPEIFIPAGFDISF
ncbi:MAG: hypothetical protein EBU93_01835 [Chlamydiae bacterium]|nr:hypothetical protein [Chlamydiota bacterium]